MEKLSKVSSKGQVVIPAPMRRRLKIATTVLLTKENGRIILVPSKTVEEAFGSGGPEMAKVAIEISKERRREVRRESEKAGFICNIKRSRWR